MKFEYTSPELEIKKFAVAEIITESGTTSEPTSGGLVDTDSEPEMNVGDIFG